MHWDYKVSDTPLELVISPKGEKQSTDLNEWLPLFTFAYLPTIFPPYSPSHIHLGPQALNHML